MDYSKFPKPQNDGKADHLLNKFLPDISLKNQQGNLLKIKRSDTFRLILYFYPMTGNPNQSLPKNWNQTPGAIGCTVQTCSFRDNYEELIKLNALPIGISTQTIDYIREMTDRLVIPFDVLSDFAIREGIKEYSDWPTIPQVYLKGEFLGGSDILIDMYNSGSLKEKIEIELAS